MITINNIDDICEIKLNTAKFTLFNTEETKTEIMALFSRPNLKLLINMQDVQFIDSSGFAVFLTIAKEANRTGGQIIYCNVGDAALHLFEVLQLHRTFKIIPDRKEALLSFR